MYNVYNESYGIVPLDRERAKGYKFYKLLHAKGTASPIQSNLAISTKLRMLFGHRNELKS